jgi:hypothetical protein
MAEYEPQYPALAHAIDQLAIAMREEGGQVDHGEAVLTLQCGHQFKITLDIIPDEETEDGNTK